MKKTAIVTGSSRGIGFAIARQLGLDGYNIVMVATGPQEKNQHALDELKTQGIDCAYVQALLHDRIHRQLIATGEERPRRGGGHPRQPAAAVDHRPSS